MFHEDSDNIAQKFNTIGKLAKKTSKTSKFDKKCVKVSKLKLNGFMKNLIVFR